MRKDSLGDRMKDYENNYRYYLTKKTPVILRLDGKAFHTFTKNFEKPYARDLRQAMIDTTENLLKEIQGAKLAYVQSDEISILLDDLDKPETSAWFGNNLQKIVSISAATASVYFNQCLQTHSALFDARAFNIPEAEIYNYFKWRQLDWIRNSVQMLGQAHYSHKQLNGKSCEDIKKMLSKEKNINWENEAAWWKYGTFIINNTRKLKYSFKHLMNYFDNLDQIINSLEW